MRLSKGAEETNPECVDAGLDLDLPMTPSVRDDKPAKSYDDHQ
jgi:hypothetical protein